MPARTARVITAATLALAVLTWTAHCATAPEGQPAGNDRQAAKTFQSAEKGFSITFPADWEIKPNPPTIVTALRPAAPGDTFRENVNVVVEALPKPMTPRQYLDAAIALMKKSLPDFAEIDRDKAALQVADAGYVIYTYKMGPMQVKNVAYVIPRGLSCFVITCTATPDTFLEYWGDFEDIALSFKLDPSVSISPDGLYSNREKGFSIKFPADWAVTTSEVASAAVVALRPVAAGDATFRENVNIVVKDCGSPITVDEYNDATWKYAAARLPGFRQIESGKATIGDADARFLGYSWTPVAGKAGKNLAYVLTKGLRAYVITCTATPETFDKYRPAFEEIANSFKMIE